tara:strand:- start:404 stop:601 length:198 start_codon:yes stop_codon:yes gene_type:complete
MDYPNKTERQIEVVVKAMLVAIVFFGILATTSCFPESCWDCRNVMTNGVIDEICWEVDCNINAEY